MAGLKSLRSRIKTIKSTQKITKAMQMVAASKLARAKEAVDYSRSFYDKVEAVLAAAITRVEIAGADAMLQSLLSDVTQIKQTIAIIVSSDRGLCGSFNVTLWRKVREELKLFNNLKIITVGQKLYENIKSSNSDQIIKHFSNTAEIDSINTNIVKILEDAIIQESATQIIIYHMQYKNTLLQVPRKVQLWPFDLKKQVVEPKHTESNIEFEGAELLPQLLKLHLNTNLTLAVLESRASEEAARTTAMDSATRNAGKVISRLTLKMNRTRQTQITNELIEVISGAEAI